MEEDYQTWKSLELLQLLEMMNEEECPTGHFYKKFEEIAEMTAEKLHIDPKEVKWLLKKKRTTKSKARRKRRKRGRKSNGSR